MRRVLLCVLIMLVTTSVLQIVNAKFAEGESIVINGNIWTRDSDGDWWNSGNTARMDDAEVKGIIAAASGTKTTPPPTGISLSTSATPPGTSTSVGSASPATTTGPGKLFRAGKNGAVSGVPAGSAGHSAAAQKLIISASTGEMYEIGSADSTPSGFEDLNADQEKWAREQSSDATFNMVAGKLTAVTEPTVGDDGKVNGIRVTKEFTDKAIADKWGHKTTTEYIKNGNTIKKIVEDQNTNAVTQWQVTDKKSGTQQELTIVYEKSIVRGGNIVRSSNKPLYADLGDNKYLNYEDGKIYSQAPTNVVGGKAVFSGTGAEVKTLGKDSKAGKAYQEVKNARLNFRIKDTLEAAQFHLTEYQGLSGFSSLFFKDKDLAAWRRTTEEFFCSTILLGGIDCWTSKICDDYDDRPGGDGVFIGTQLGGDKTAIAHIEAERSMPATFLNGTLGNGNQMTQVSEVSEYVYKMTYFVRNPQADDDDDESDLSYNIVFEPGGYRAFPANKPLKPGASASAVGQAAIVKYSRKLYTKVCLVFSPALEGFSNEKVTKVCNNICGGIIDPEENECKPLETAVLPPGTAPKPSGGTGTDWSGF